MLRWDSEGLREITGLASPLPASGGPRGLRSLSRVLYNGKISRGRGSFLDIHETVCACPTLQPLILFIFSYKRKKKWNKLPGIRLNKL